MERQIYVSREGMMKFDVEYRVRAPPPTLVRYTEVHDELDRHRSVCSALRPDHTKPRHEPVP
jgi:hypothetical protein